MILKILTERFSVCKIEKETKVPVEEEFVFFGRTDEEMSLVCPMNCVPHDVLYREDGWKGFRIQGELDFSLIGILAKIAQLLADQEIGIFVISTYNTDYVFVKEDNLTAAVQALSDAGYRFEPEAVTTSDRKAKE